MLTIKEIYEMGKFLNSKGGEKLKPYFETKVVKVKKPEAKNKYITTAKIDGKLYGFLYFNYSMDDRRLVMEEIKKKPKKKCEGNWVNGENVDKIKFPCFCSYKLNDTKWMGEINKSWRNGFGFTYYLSNINQQRACSMVNENASLKELIKNYDIHILKGKIIIFEEG